MSTFPYASRQYARALLDESAPGEELVSSKGADRGGA